MWLVKKGNRKWAKKRLKAIESLGRKELNIPLIMVFLFGISKEIHYYHMTHGDE